VERVWPSGEVWTYAYDGSNRLVAVSDDYGRQLVFRYITSGAHAGQLYRVGDHTFDDADPQNPTGQYVEYGYTLNKVSDSNGTITDGDKSLLTSVRDVLGHVWTYDYYGQNAGETDSRQLNFLTKRESPSVDTDGDGNADHAVSYSYDLGGQRTQITLPGDLTITYTYDRRRRLVGLTDWDGHEVRYAHDRTGRLLAEQWKHRLLTRYGYDAGGHLRWMRTTNGPRLLGHFAFEVDGRGNRVQALECVPHPGTGSTTIASDDKSVDYYQGSWSANGDFQVSSDFSAALRLLFFGNEATLTLGTGSDHGICDVYVGNELWRSFDTYAATSGEVEITIPLQSEEPHVLEIRNRPENHMDSTGYRLRFS